MCDFPVFLYLGTKIKIFLKYKKAIGIAKKTMGSLSRSKKKEEKEEEKEGEEEEEE